MYLLQTEAELVTANPVLSILTAFHREKLALRQRHVAVAKQVADYNFNNTYQYVINREDVHLSWLEAAITELGVTPENVAEPTLPVRGKKDSITPLVSEDSRDAAALVARWRPRLPEITNARHQNMVGLILGETLEQKRFFDQMLEGRDDLLGRRSNGPGKSGTGNGVLPVRWIE
jgi:hypothetical protein